jgi:hypothetical protein
LSTTTIWKRVSKYFYLLIELRNTYIRDVYSHIKQDGNADSGKHSDWMLTSWPADFAHDIVWLLKTRETEDDGKESMGVTIRIARVGEGARGLGICSNMLFHWLAIRTFQTSCSNNNSCHDDKEKNHDLNHSQHVVEQNATSSRERMNKASENCDTNGDASNSTRSRMLFSRCSKHSGSEADTVACHVSKSYKTEAEHACAQEDGAISVGRLSIDVLEVVEVSATAWNTLLDTVDGITRNIEAILDVYMNTRETIDDSSEPEEK